MTCVAKQPPPVSYSRLSQRKTTVVAAGHLPRERVTALPPRPAPPGSHHLKLSMPQRAGSTRLVDPHNYAYHL